MSARADALAAIPRELPAGPSSDRVVLAIESSCDETCAAVVAGRDVRSDVVASQAELHGRFGGVVPEVASRRHLELVDLVVEQALEEAGIGAGGEGLDAVAVTRGPGLVGALLVGLAHARARSWAWDLPLLGVDHLVGHVASALLAPEGIRPPYLCLLASGGHTLLLDVDEELAITLLGSTRDDAAGEAFDKGARLLGLPMPGGPSLERLAADGDPSVAPMTPAMVHHDTLDTSFAGLKTALAMASRDPDAPAGADLAAAFQLAIVETLDGAVRKLLRRRGPGSGHPHARERLAVVGGVAANFLLRAKLSERCRESGVELVATPLRWCGDNAAMIGVASSWSEEYDAGFTGGFGASATSSLFRTGRLVPKATT